MKYVQGAPVTRAAALGGPLPGFPGRPAACREREIKKKALVGSL
jgi:hypothetical protein